jgi:alpha-1,2-mannosyltransferase
MSKPTVWWWVGGLVVVTLVVLVVATNVPGSLVDLRVYRSGGAAWLHGVPLYTKEFPSYLPFTYPPVSAVAFGVLAMAPLLVAATALTVAGLAALSATTILATPARFAAPAVMICAFAFEPVRSTLLFGQVNLVLMGLVAADCLLPRTRYPRGLLIGVAAAVKLTPAVFVLFFLARRQYPPVVTAAVTFACVTGLGMLLAPADSVAYWHVTIFDPSRIGGAAFATNQSLRGALTRLGLGQDVWLVLAAAVLVLAWHGARRAHRLGDPVVALLVVAAAGLLVSPVSWSHHWVWIVPAVAVFATRVGPTPALLATTALFTVGHRFLPHARDRELAWTWWQHVAGNSYLLVALGFLVWSVTRQRDVPHVGGGRPAVSVGGRG